MWSLWVLGGLVVWFLVALGLGVLLGGSIGLAERSSRPPREAGLAIADMTALTATTASGSARPRRVRRRAVPLPPVGIALAGSAVALTTSGYLLQLNGSTGEAARLLFLDEPHSLPRLYVAFVFAAAAIAAVTGAGRLPGRRIWWLAVGLVGGGIAATNTGSAAQSRALRGLVDVVGAPAAGLLGASAAAFVLAALWFLSRSERRDRRRMLSILALYVGASGGLSAITALATDAYGATSNWAAAVVYLQHSGKALAGVAFLIAVLVGVAPRLILPATWALRRADDASLLDGASDLPGRSASGLPARG